MLRTRDLLAASVAGAMLVSLPARAWQVDDPIHKDCHERLTASALKAAGYVREPPALSPEDTVLRKSLQFDATKYDANIYALSLILGARWPDAQGAADFDFYQLSEVHNALGDQGAHCLRSESQDGGEAGDRAALADCRAQIERYYWLALKTLDEHGNVDPDSRELLTEFLPFTGKSQVPVSGFYVYAGIASHAIEDSFTHSFRTEDGKKLLHIFNWSDQVRGTLDEAKDGHGHETVLDKCEAVDPATQYDKRMAWATAAVQQFLTALREPGNRDEREARIKKFLDDWMTYEPKVGDVQCSAANDYCDHPVQKWLKNEGKMESNNYAPAGCESTGGEPAMLALLGVLAAGMVRRRRQLVAPLAALVVLVPVASKADEPAPAAPAPAASMNGMRYEIRASMSVQNPAYAVNAAAKYQFKHADVGLFAELNPWYSVEKRMAMLGSTNIGIQAHYLHQLRPDLSYRVGAGLGVSILNQELYGTNPGTKGPYVNLRLLGLVWQFSDVAALTVDAFDLALPVPQLTGWPILYAQHRFSVGLQFGGQ